MFELGRQLSGWVASDKWQCSYI